jgi:EAL domain-containing protein (putative c-di-GMP-specific phosphodiesterase class I)
MAKRLNLTTVAEGVETATQAALLLEFGCDCGQGYLYSWPVGASQCMALLQELDGHRALTDTMVIRAVAAG